MMYFKMALRDDPPRSFRAAIAAETMSAYFGCSAGFFAAGFLAADFLAGESDIFTIILVRVLFARNTKITFYDRRT